MRVFLAFFLTIAIAGAQAPQASPTARLEGRVVDDAGKPVARATARLVVNISAGDEPLATVSDEDGNFAFDKIIPRQRTYQLLVTRTGYVDANYGAKPRTTSGTPLLFEPGQVMKGVVVTMIAQGVITGRVVDEAGDPLPRVSVALMSSSWRAGKRTYAAAMGATTDDLGNYRMANVAPGRYKLRAQDIQGFEDTYKGAKQQMHRTTYFPNGSDASEGKFIEVTSGATLRGIDFQLPLTRVFTAHVKMLPAVPGAPVEGMNFSPTMPDGAIQYTNMVENADGTFDLTSLPPGHYVVRATQFPERMRELVNQARAQQNLPPYAASSAQAGAGKMELTIVDHDLDGLTLQLTSGGTVHGKVSMEGGDLTSLLAVAPGMRPFEVGLDPPAGGYSANSARLNPDGTFELKGLDQGEHTFSFDRRLPEGIYLKSVKLGDDDVTNGTINLKAGGSATIAVVLSNKPSDVVGVVHTSSGVTAPNAQVVMWPTVANGGYYGQRPWTIASDQNASFKLGGLPPGEYRVAAFESVDQGLLSNRDFLSAFDADTTKLSIAEGSHQAVELKLIPVAKSQAVEEKLP